MLELKKVWRIDSGECEVLWSHFSVVFLPQTTNSVSLMIIVFQQEKASLGKFILKSTERPSCCLNSQRQWDIFLGAAQPRAAKVSVVCLCVCCWFTVCHTSSWLQHVSNYVQLATTRPWLDYIGLSFWSLNPTGCPATFLNNESSQTLSKRGWGGVGSLNSKQLQSYSPNNITQSTRSSPVVSWKKFWIVFVVRDPNY